MQSALCHWRSWSALTNNWDCSAPTDDFKTDLENFHRLERLISYDSAKEQILIAADTARLSSELPAPYDRAATELPLAIGIVHALQQQHFQWQEKISGTFTDDTRLAYRAIAGGDALLTALAYITRRQPRRARPPYRGTANCPANGNTGARACQPSCATN